MGEVIQLAEGGLVQQINEQFQRLQSARQRTKDEAIALGRKLLEAKALYGQHGNWLKWLAQNCPVIGQKQADKYMRIANSQISTSANLTREAEQAPRLKVQPPRGLLNLVRDIELADKMERYVKTACEAEQRWRESDEYKQGACYAVLLMKLRWAVEEVEAIRSKGALRMLAKDGDAASGSLETIREFLKEVSDGCK
jgi:hypothetical protein